MARFRLKSKHYLNLAGDMAATYEYTEESLGNAPGRRRSKKHSAPVPVYLDPDDPGDQTPPNSGEIIVSTEEDRRYPHDLIFVGDPTTDMEPLDEEADAMLAALGPKIHPIEGMGDRPYADALTEKLEQLIKALGGREAGIVPNVSVEEFNELKKQNAELTEKVNALLASMTPKSEKIERRV